MHHQKNMRTVFLFSVLFLSVFKLFAQSEPGKLHWSDFKGEIEADSPYAAMTYWNVKYTYQILQYKGDTAIVDIKSRYILNEKSWVRSWLASDQLLNHERGHLALAELLSLEFMSEAKQNVYLKDNCKFKIDSIFKTIHKKYVELELQYDLETKHMRDLKAQKIWYHLLERNKSYFKSGDQN